MPPAVFRFLAAKRQLFVGVGVRSHIIGVVAGIGDGGLDRLQVGTVDIPPYFHVFTPVIDLVFINTFFFGQVIFDTFLAFFTLYRGRFDGGILAAFLLRVCERNS